ncbi:DUF732 domain-containing protein [Mycobacterium lacus]|uniref:DUF732 domain-containing protein n=2 Tax=Mycobacterium lacus TaxID=169765 RepID=UPI0031016302
MFTNLAGALVAAVVVLTGGAILRGGTAAADPNQDEQFLALLNEKEIPAVANVPSVIAAAHKVCLKLDAGMPVGDVLDGLRNDAYNIDPVVRQYPARLTTTMTRFIAVAVQIYCPYDQPKIAAIMASFAPGSTEPAYRVAGHMHNMAVARPEPTGAGAVRLSHVIDGRVFVAGSLIGAVPAGDPLLPNPPQIPGPPPPTAQILTPPPPMAAPSPKQSPPAPQQPPPPQESPPPPQEPPPPPQEPPPPPQEVVEPPADAPQPGGAAGGGSGGNGGGGGIGGGGSGGNGRGGPVEPAPARPTPPGFIRLAP